MITGSRPRRKKLTPVMLAVAVAGALLVPLSGTAHAVVGSLTLHPPDQDGALGTNQVVRADIDLAQTTDTHIDFEITGDSDPDASNTPASPDEDCIIPAGQTRCTTQYAGPNVGDDLIRGWVDVDNNNATVEADTAEGLAAGTDPGDTPEPDTTDVVHLGWFALVQGTLNCSPEKATAEPGDPVSVTCRMSQGQDDVHIDAENLGGANNDPTADERADFDSACITVNGNCTTSIDPTENETGSADVCFWVDEESDASHHVNGRVRDGGGCAATALNAAENGHTDVISVGWGSRTNATVAVPQGTKNFDARFAVSGTVGSANPDCVGGLEVRVQRDVLGGASTYQNWKTTTTSDSGGYRVNGKADRSARYRARAIDAPPCLEDFSGAKIVRVAKKLTLRAPKAVGRGQIARITGKIAPCKGHKGDRITLLHKKGGSFRVLDKAKSNANCVAAFSIRINRTRVFKVRAPKTEPWLLGGTSRPKKVRAS